MATYVNDLRLTELATGEGSGTWGVTTNTNLELIGEALGYGTQDCFATDADATTTVADGASDPARAMYFKVTSSATLTATRTLTIGPNTVSRVMLIENATTGSQSIAISQGSGGNVTIANGAVKMVYLDGAGAGAAVVDALADLELGTITVANLTATTADINGGTIDGATIGGASAAAGTFTNLTATGTTTLAGASTTADITFGDNDKAIFGAGSDLQIYHDGSNSYITDAGTGNLILQATDFVLKSGGTGSYIEAVGGATKLYNSNAQKLATTATGIDVTGTVTADGLTVDGSATISGAATAGFVTPLLAKNPSTNAASAVKIGFDAGGTTWGEIGSAYNSNDPYMAFFVRSGSEKLRITDAGNVGIGVSSPTAKLHILADTPVLMNNAAGTSEGKFDFADSGATLRVHNFFGTGSNITFLTNPNGGAVSERMRIDSAGNVGIGTSSPVGRLTLRGAAGTSGKNQGISIEYSNGTEYGALGLNNSSGWPQLMARAGAGITFHTNSDLVTTGEAMRIDSSGNVGIGRTSVSYRLDVKQGTDGITAGFAGSTYGIRFDNGGTFSSGMSTIHGVDDTLTASYQPIMLNGSDVRIGTGATERARIDASGRLLVGATSAGSALNNTIELSASGSAADQPAYQVFAYPGTSNTSTGYFIFNRSTGSSVGTNTLVANDDRLGMIRWNGANGTGYTPAAEIYGEVDGTSGATDDMPGRIVFATTADGAGTTTERMRIDSSGNVGIGVTPATDWNTGYDALQIGQGAAIMSASGSEELFLNMNAKWASDSSWEYIATGTAASIRMDQTTPFTFRYAASGSADADLTWSEAMRIDSAGLVGIGTTSPQSVASGYGALTIGGTSGGGINFSSTGSAFGQIYGNNTNVVMSAFSNRFIAFNTNGSERMRIDSSGNLLVGTTTSSTTTKFQATGGASSFAGTFVNPAGSAGYGVAISSGTGEAVYFYHGGTIASPVGSISTSASATSYNTSSDERLKENITDANEAGDKIDAIQVRQFDWKADGSHQDYGMVAQELMTVAPEAVSGDPESDNMMGVDYSKLVPMLIKEIQSLRARVAQLEGA